MRNVYDKVLRKMCLKSFLEFLRCFSSYDDMNLKRRTSLPLVRSQSFQLAGKEGIIHTIHLISGVALSAAQCVCSSCMCSVR